MADQSLMDFPTILGLVNGIGATIIALVWKAMRDQDARLRLIESATAVVRSDADHLQKRFDRIDDKLERILHKLADVEAHVDYLEREIRS